MIKFAAVLPLSLTIRRRNVFFLFLSHLFSSTNVYEHFVTVIILLLLRLAYSIDGFIVNPQNRWFIFYWNIITCMNTGNILETSVSHRAARSMPYNKFMHTTNCIGSWADKGEKCAAFVLLSLWWSHEKFNKPVHKVYRQHVPLPFMRSVFVFFFMKYVVA